MQSEQKSLEDMIESRGIHGVLYCLERDGGRASGKIIEHIKQNCDDSLENFKGRKVHFTQLGSFSNITLLHAACYSKNSSLELLESLIEQGCGVNNGANSDYQHSVTPLFFAAVAKNEEKVKFLLTKDAIVNQNIIDSLTAVSEGGRREPRMTSESIVKVLEDTLKKQNTTVEEALARNMPKEAMEKRGL